MIIGSVRDSAAVLNDPPPAALERHVYGDQPLQFGDLRRPNGGEPHCLVVVLHGGGWKSNFNLIHTGHMCIALGKAGYATFNVEYRRVGDPGGGWPGSFEDVLLALDYALALPDVDRSRVVLVGHSAGGHLALLAAWKRRLPVIPLAPSSDFGVWQNEASVAFLGGTDGAEASPRTKLPLGVRQVFVHGTNDDQVPFWLSTKFVDAARSAGDDADLIVLEGAGHFDLIDPHSRHWARVVGAVDSIIGKRVETTGYRS
jgi:acetyl esterase/lipase